MTRRFLAIVVTALLAGACTSSPPRRASPAPLAITPEVLARYAPGPLPADVRRQVQTLLDVRSPGSGQLSPDGTRLFFTWSVTGSSQVWRLDGPQRFPVQLTGGEDPTTLEGVMPDGRHIVVSRDRGGAENPGLYLQSADGGPLDVIFQKDGVRAFLGYISEDGGSIFYEANDRKPDSYAVYRYDVASHRAELVFGEDGLWTIADHRPDGRLLLARQIGSEARAYSAYDPATRTLTPRLGRDESEDYTALFGAADDELIVLTPKLGDFRRLYRFRGGELVPISPEINHDVSTFTIDDSRRRILYTVNDGGYTRLRAMDAHTFADLPLPALPAADHVTFGSTTADGRYATITVGTATAPSASVVLDWTTGVLTQWHAPSTPEVDTAHFAVATAESYPARDGTAIPMFVRRPNSCAAPCPVVVSFHGGPEAQSQPGFNPAAQLFVDAGFVYVEPNVRGSEGYGKAWLHADDGPRRLDVITDIEDCARFIRSHWGVDGRPPKVGITGASYGGYSTLVGMTMFAGAYDAGVSVVGISDLATFLRNTAPYRRALRITEYGDPDRDRDALAKLSPMTYVDRVRAPLLIIAGANDPRVPASEGLQMQSALEARKAGSTLILLPDEGHGSQKRDNRVLERGHILKFFQMQLSQVSSSDHP